MSLRMSEEEYLKILSRRVDPNSYSMNVPKCCNQKVTSKEKPPLEDQEQAALIVWLKQRGIRHQATPNGGYRHKATAGKLKVQGVVAGFPDLTVWPPPNAPTMPILFIELKRIKGGVVSPEQQEWLDYLNQLDRVGYPIKQAVCKGFEAARQFILQWGY